MSSLGIDGLSGSEPDSLGISTPNGGDRHLVLGDGAGFIRT